MQNNAGVVSAEEIRGVIREDERSGYNALAEEMEGEGLPEEGDPFENFEGDSEEPQDDFSMDEFHEYVQFIKSRNSIMAGDKWEESKHPRKKNGQFGEGGSSSGVEKSSKRDKIDSSKHKTVNLPKEEYAQVMHELNTNLTKEQRNKKQLSKPIGDYIYHFENNGFDNYRIIRKSKIDT